MRTKMVKGKSFGIILAVALAALLLVSACGVPTTPTGEKVVQLADIEALTGGGATDSQVGVQGYSDYVRYFNEEKGIPGVTIKFVWRDCATEIARWMSSYQVLADQKLPLIQTGFATFLDSSFNPTLEKNGTVLAMGSSTLAMLNPPGWFFSDWAANSEEIAVFLDYFMENWQEQRPPRLQFISIETAGFGRQTCAEASKYAESIGFEVLPVEISPIVPIDSSVQLLRIRENQPDLVWVQHITSGAGPIMRDAERLGLQDLMQFAGPEASLGQQLITMAPVGSEGYFTPKCLPWMDETEIPGVKTMVDTYMKYHGGVQGNYAYMRGWVEAAIGCEAVKRAGEEVGYDNIDGATIKRVLESMQDFDAAGIAKVTFGPEDRRGITRYAIYQVQGGKIVRVSDYREAPILTP